MKTLVTLLMFFLHLFGVKISPGVAALASLARSRAGVVYSIKSVHSCKGNVYGGSYWQIHKSR